MPAVTGLELLTATKPGSVLGQQLRAMAGAGEDTPCRVVDMRLVPGERSHVLFRVGERHFVGSVEDGEGSRLVLSPIECDTALPGLALIHDTAALSSLVDEWLPGPKAARCRARLLRYRPGRRATFLVEKTAIDGQRRLVRQRVIAKLYHDRGKAQSVHDAMVALTKRPTAPTLTVARPIGIDASSCIVAQTVLPGRPLAPLLVTATDRAAEALGRAARGLATLHQLRNVSERALAVEHTLDKLRRRAEALALVEPERCRRLVSLTRRLADQVDHEGASSVVGVLLHGDAKADQFLLLGDGVGLLDFDHVGVGDPALDIADFTAKLRQRSLASGRTDRATTEHFERTFLAAYAAATGAAPDLARRVTFNAAVSLARRALRSYQRAPASELGPRLVAESQHQLDILRGQ